MSQLGKGIEDNKATLAIILAKLINPSVPTGFDTSSVDEQSASSMPRMYNSVPTTPQTPMPTTAHTPMPTTPLINATECAGASSGQVTPESTVSAISITPSTDENLNDAGFLTPQYLNNMLKKCCSRKNFATKLVCKLFNEDIRKKSNVAGKLGKAKLNPVVIEYIKSLTFQHYPLEAGESEEKEWKSCIIAIDSNSRSLNRKK